MSNSELLSLSAYVHGAEVDTQSNTWDVTTESTLTLGCMGKVLGLEEVPRHCVEQCRRRGKEIAAKTGSKRLVQALKDISATRSSIKEAQMETQSREMDATFAELVHNDVAQQRVSQLMALSSHIDSVLANSGDLVTRLQQPRVKDQLAVDAAFQESAVRLFRDMGARLSTVAACVDDAAWAHDFSLEDGRLQGSLAQTSTLQARYQTRFQALSRVRRTIARLEEALALQDPSQPADFVDADTAAEEVGRQ